MITKNKVGYVATTGLALSVACFSSALHAQDAGAVCDQQSNNDEMYCRFFATDIVGDVEHVEQLTQVQGGYWFTDRNESPATDVYAFYWCSEADASVAGVALRFTRGGGKVIEMLGTLGFEPSVNYWQCNK